MGRSDVRVTLPAGEEGLPLQHMLTFHIDKDGPCNDLAGQGTASCVRVRSHARSHTHTHTHTHTAAEKLTHGPGSMAHRLKTGMQCHWSDPQRGDQCMSETPSGAGMHIQDANTQPQVGGNTQAIADAQLQASGLLQLYPARNAAIKSPTQA